MLVCRNYQFVLILRLSLVALCDGFRSKKIGNEANALSYEEGGFQGGIMVQESSGKIGIEKTSLVEKGQVAGDVCLTCIENGGGKGCAARCTGKGGVCKNCVENGGGRACASHCGGRPGPGSNLSPSPIPSGDTINWNSMSSKVSKYFTVREVTNGETRRIPKTPNVKNNVVRLANELDKVREAWGGPLLVNSWYRPPDVNRAVGGAANSQHLNGSAVDIRPANGQIQKFQAWLDNGMWKDKALGYGSHLGFVHLDLRPGHIRWNYR